MREINKLILILIKAICLYGVVRDYTYACELYTCQILLVVTNNLNYHQD